MIQVTPHHRILLSVQPLDFRKGIDALIGVCRQQLESDPFSGIVYVFVNRRHTALKLLIYDGQGFWLCMKRLSHGRLQWWPSSAQATCVLTASELSILLYNGNPKAAQITEDWRPVLT